ncbi:hypothetical protein EUGRSUZ_I00149 [Eucalyptus grandis]|uniref:Uncharacterized protein n=2 Tax=Eucalyptus grandis TaxID=71139 RepID=A0ACC3JE04_EUCGR|nr:hypothetical protein EUGRSUZ_I00149 [Eucalyptus grandis]
MLVNKPVNIPIQHDPWPVGAVSRNLTLQTSPRIRTERINLNSIYIIPTIENPQNLIIIRPGIEAKPKNFIISLRMAGPNHLVLSGE